MFFIECIFRTSAAAEVLFACFSERKQNFPKKPDCPLDKPGLIGYNGYL